MGSENRIPADKSTDYGAWDLPAVEGKHIVGRGGQNSDQPSGFHRGDVVQSEHVNINLRKYGRLTASELERIAEEAYQEGLQKGRDTGHAQGYDAGLAQGLEEGREQALAQTSAQMQAQLARLEKVLAALIEPVEKEDRQLEAALLSMVHNIAAAVVKQELQLNPEQTQRIVREAMAALPVGAKHIKVYVNDSDVDAINQLCQAGHKDWQIVADGEVSPGGCRVETDRSLVDYTVDARLRQAMEKLVSPAYPSTVTGTAQIEDVGTTEHSGTHTDINTGTHTGTKG